MTGTSITKLEDWISGSGVEQVTGVHITKSIYDGLGIEFNKEENLQDEEDFLKAQKNEEDGDKDGGEPDLDEDEEDEKILLLVPSELILSPDRIRELAQDDEKLQKWLELENISDTDVLHRGLLYLWLCKKDNPWTEYFETLPKNIDLPFTYSIKKMESLDFSTVSIHHAAITKRLSLEKSYERFVHDASTSRKLELWEWLLPHAWISSRGLTHPLTGQTCLVPLIDLCNHSSKKSNVRYDADEEGNFELLLTEPVGDFETGELFLNYGDRSTSEFLFNYGFVPDDRSEDDFEELFKLFDPSADEIRDIIDPSRYKKDQLSKEEKQEWEMTYDVLLDFFEEEAAQILRIIRFPKIVEPEEAKRYRFHNNFIMALASNDHLELYKTSGPEQGLYLGETKLTTSNVFSTARQLGDDKVLSQARELVANLCEYFANQVSAVSHDRNDDPWVVKVATAESSLYRNYAKSSRKLVEEDKK